MISLSTSETDGSGTVAFVYSPMNSEEARNTTGECPHIPIFDSGRNMASLELYPNSRNLCSGAIN